ncbi:MAG: polysaccharide biosynthesis C-terminal domain-containing protein [Cyclobacteriaceae bacterium]
MGIVRRQSILNLIISYSGVLIGFINVSLLFPHFFTSDEYGLRSVLLETAMILSFMLAFGSNHVVHRYFPKIDNTDEKKKKLFIIIAIIPFFFLLVSYFVYVPFVSVVSNYYLEKAPLFSQYFKYTFPIACLMAYLLLISSFSVVNYKTIFQNFVRDILLRVMLTILILLYGYDLISFSGFWFGFCVTYLVAILILIGYSYKDIKKILKIKINYSYKELNIKELITFMSMSVLGASVALLALRVDVLMIAGELGEKYAGVYGLSVYLLSLADMPRRSLSTISAPIISKYVNTTDYSEIITIQKKTSVNLLIISGLVISLIWVNLESFYEIIPKGEFLRLGMITFLILAISKLFDGVIGLSGEIIAYSKYYKYNIIISIITLALAIGLNRLLIPMYGLEGAAFASLISIAVSKISRLFIVYRKFRITPFSTNYFRSVFFTGLLILITYYVQIDTDTIIVNIIFNTGIVLVLFTCIVLAFKPSQDITQLITVTMDLIRKKLSKSS